MKTNDIFGVLAASALSITIFVRANYLPAGGLSEFLNGGGAGFVILQLVIIIKYVTASLVVMPDNFRTKQLVIGFLTSDLFILLFCLFLKRGFPLHLIIVQLLITAFCLGYKERKRINWDLDTPNQKSDVK